MNQVKGKIVHIESADHLSLVSIQSKSTTFTSIVIETPDSAPYLKLGNDIHVLFKETEVVIGKEINYSISMQNQLLCRIKQIEEGKLLSRIILEFEGKELSSIITTKAIKSLDLKEKDEVVAMIKTNEIMLSEI